VFRMWYVYDISTQMASTALALKVCIYSHTIDLLAL